MDTPVLLRVQKSDLRGLGTSAMSFSDSGGIFGRAGMEESWWAVVVAKNIERT
jgi:hypothetical protein